VDKAKKKEIRMGDEKVVQLSLIFNSPTKELPFGEELQDELLGNFVLTHQTFLPIFHPFLDPDLLAECMQNENIPQDFWE
jgi:hypothetical protein